MELKKVCKLDNFINKVTRAESILLYIKDNGIDCLKLFDFSNFFENLFKYDHLYIKGNILQDYKVWLELQTFYILYELIEEFPEIKEYIPDCVFKVEYFNEYL